MIRFTSNNYAPEKIAKRYVRVDEGLFFVDECAALPEGHWLAKIGAGPTLRSYQIAAHELPVDIRKAAWVAYETRVSPRAVEWPL